jgi:hypothetical protein
MATTELMLTKDGRSSMLIKPLRQELRVSTKNSDSTSTDLSTLDQECQCKELLSVMVPTMSGLRDGERTLLLSNGTSMKFLRPSKTTTGSLTHWTFKATEAQQISDVPLPIQDGGNYLNTKMLSLLMREVRLFMSKVTSMLKTETLKQGQKMERSTNNGTSSTLMNGRENQEKEN